ncbi:4-hydroxy-3-methylbut-2-enyl diphosphate reductase [Clostridium sp. C105KSO13]|uniref:4-hydroxy-3-methylbut-2-enyl diphosphate reductase n=1 Tax=Clostridium sp. C105KSO13 TaxID=1776045 RepID=UPI000740748F|nr:4-hydroxy-3-methylbut-2-enyl diphosphate reductase [Clostridium sp. C105KSO13]CUX43749.1 4-hydroxy-3-methylbut-2-enyl diphosphate reductase [Clostridium sp. C105KSO13]
MEIKQAKTAGFCFGVKRAVDEVYKQLENEKDSHTPICTYGPIIHNEEVIKDMEKKGVKVLKNQEELEGLTEGIVIIRSHGVSEAICEDLYKRGLTVMDATCPFVKKIHKIVKEESQKGRHVVIIGNPDHPEVEGIRGWAGEYVTVIQNTQEAENFMPESGKKVCIVAQTTFNYNKFKDLVEIILKKGYDVSVLNTICSATKERQTEAQSIAEEVDAMIVIGDKHSSNTQKLFEICQKACKDTYYIQTLDDLDLNQLGSVETVGITAGASTPNNIIEEVQNNVRIIF